MASTRMNGRSYSFSMILVCVAGSSLVAVVSSASRILPDGPHGSSRTVQHLLSDQQIEDSEAIRLIFEQGTDSIPPLISELRKGHDVERASQALAYLAGPNEREILRGVISNESDCERKSTLASFLAGALVEPASEEEWGFLENSLKGYNEEGQVFTALSAALALAANGSSRALILLEAAVLPDELRDSDNDAIRGIREAIHWVEQRSAREAFPSLETNSDSEQVKQAVLRTVLFVGRESGQMSLGDVSFSRGMERALLPVEVYKGPKNAQGYNVVLRRTGRTWHVTGVWLSWVS